MVLALWDRSRRAAGVRLGMSGRFGVFFCTSDMMLFGRKDNSEFLCSSLKLRLGCVIGVSAKCSSSYECEMQSISSVALFRLPFLSAWASAHVSWVGDVSDV
jgi:hypothetical protein